jgi:polysaccharide chain length determinant protein (PEP-CTERM system associated)
METPSATLKPEDILAIVSRRRWFILLPLFFAVAAGIYLAFTLPKIYEARTLILVQGQKVPTEFVRSVVTEDVDSRVSTISQQIMSRTNLERVIEEFDLFSGSRSENMFLEEKIKILRKKIKVDVMREHRRGEADAFSISFQWTQPHKTMQVVNELTRYFIDTNLKVREAQAMGTSDFLNDELVKIKQQLDDMEAALKDFRQRHMGELPEQLRSNLAILQRLQEQLTAKQDSLRDAKLGISLIDQQIREGKNIAALPNTTKESGTTEIGATNDLGVLRQQLMDLRTRYTERHPDVTRLKNKIAELEAGDAGSGIAGTAESPSGGKVVGNSPASFYSDPITRQRADLMRDRLELEAEIEDLNKQIAVYEQRVENTPKREQELLSIKRDYDNVKGVYNSLLSRKLEAELAVSMERKQKGEQFFVLDNAKLPEKPVAPNMKKLFMMALAAGLGLGCGLAYLLEYLDTSYRRPEEIESTLKLPVIATIPPVYRPGDVTRMRLASALSFLFAGVITVMTGFFAVVALKGTAQVLELLRRYVNI